MTEEHKALIPARRTEPYGDLPAAICRRHPQFEASQEFTQLVESGCDDLPGVVLAAFGRYLIRRVHENNEDIASGYEVLESLASSSDGEVRNALVVEVFEVRDEPGETLRSFRSRLGNAAAQLYDEHCKAV